VKVAKVVPSRKGIEYGIIENSGGYFGVNFRFKTQGD